MRTKKQRIDIIESEIDILNDKYHALTTKLWKLENPPTFSVGDKVEFKSGQTGGKFMKARVVDIEYGNEYWSYSLWVYDWNRLSQFDGECSFYDQRHVQIRKYVKPAKSKE